MKNKTACFLFAFAFIAVQSLLAAEADNFTDREKIPDSTVWLNKKMNTTLLEAAQKTSSCSVYSLHKELYKKMGGTAWARIEYWSNENPGTYRIPMMKSVYSGLWLKFSAGIPFRTFYSQNVLRIGDVIIGDDKLGHFFEIAYGIYLATHKDKQPGVWDARGFLAIGGDYIASYGANRKKPNQSDREYILEYSDSQEKGNLGIKLSGIYSYADIAANYDGYRFISELTEGTRPFFLCQDNSWKLIRKFDWRDYVSSAWDEGINCSQFYGSYTPLVQSEIQKRAIGGCPVKPQTCIELVKKYGEDASKILHPRCFNIGAM